MSDRLYIDEIMTMNDSSYFTFKTLPKTFIMSHFNLSGSFDDYVWTRDTGLDFREYITFEIKGDKK